MTEKKYCEINDIVQLNPETVGNKAFAACFMVVTELKEWGVQGYVQMPGTREGGGGQAYYRAKWAELEVTGGKGVWVVP